jgi:branched-chain amino acid transport system ATP-binding protein
MAEDYLLATEGLTMDFQGFVAVKDVALKVRRGSIHGLIGPNGAGKTTCFNLLTKFLTPTRGRITFDGRDITRLPAAQVARLGMVRSFQISAVFPHLSVLENVRVALQRRRGRSFDFWRSEAVLDIDRVVALIRRAAADRTVLMVEHNLSVVSRLCQTITVMARGEVLAEGDYASVSQSPAVIEAYMGTAHA